MMNFWIAQIHSRSWGTLAGRIVLRKCGTKRLFIGFVTAGLLLLSPNGAWASPDVTFDGVISTVPTGSVSLSIPEGVATDFYGNTYISDSGNNRIIKVTSNGSASVLSITGLTTGLSLPGRSSSMLPETSTSAIGQTIGSLWLVPQALARC